MTLSDVRDWLKTLAPAGHYYIGKLDRKEDKSLGVYSRASTGTPPTTALGGLASTKTAVKRVSLLLHWNNNAKETEAAAQELFDRLRAAENIRIGGHRADYLRLLVPEPVDVGTDETGVYERVIWMDVYYERIE